jgi:hypothetical protein
MSVTFRSLLKSNLRLRVILAAVIVALALPASLLQAQDTRTVLEPVIPSTCTAIAAQQAIASGEPTSETTLDTTAIQTALNACPSGQAVELTLGGTGNVNNAFLIGPISIPTGVTLVVDGGVTVFGSRNPMDYQSSTSGAEICGTVGTAGNGCMPLISISGTSSTPSTGSGVMGFGIINGRGGDKLLLNGVTQTYSWWDLANQANTGGGKSQNNPILMYAKYANNFTLYKLTLTNSPMFHVKYQYGSGFTVWGIKIVAPYSARNTDGIDPDDRINNVTITNSYISDGDDNVALGASGTGNGVSNVTVSNTHTYAGHGLSIGSYTSGGINNVYMNNINMSGNISDTNSAGLKIKSAQDRGGVVNSVSYNNVCIQNIKYPLQFNPTYNTNTGTLIPQYTNIALHGVSVFAINSSQVQLQGLSANFPLGIQLDDLNIYNFFQLTPTPQYANIQLGPGPVNPNQLQTLNGRGINYTGVITNPSEAAHACPASSYPFLAGDMFLSTPTSNNKQTLSLPDPASFTLNAVVEIVESSSPAPTSSVSFYEGAKLVGTGSLGGNGTIASVTLNAVTAGTHTYTATYSGDPNYASISFGPVVVTVATTPSTTTMTASPTATQYGNNVALVATVKQNAGTLVPTGTVTFRSGSTQVGTATLSSGTATLNTTNLPFGTDQISAYYGGDAQSSISDSSASPVTVQISQASTTAAIKSSIANAVYGSTITFTATLAPAASGIPTGSVTFMDGATILGTGTLNGKPTDTATYTTTTLPTGTHNVTAVYGGDTNFTGSTSAPTTVIVFTSATQTTVGFSTGSAPYGTSITLAAGITSNGSSAATSTGTITFYDNSVKIATVTIQSGASGATYVTSTLAIGTHNIYGVYSGDGNYTGSTSSTAPLVITQAGSTTTLGASSTSLTYGSPDTFTATVTPTTTGTATGTVAFFDGTTSLGSQPLSGTGTAMLTVPVLAGGTHSITVSYAGDTNFTASTSSALAVLVNTAPTTIAITVPAPITYGNPAQLSATVSSTVSGTPTGTVTFKDGTTTLGTGTVTGGVATYTANNLTGGTHTITAIYTGDTNFATSTSAAGTLTVNKATTTSAVAANPAAITYGASTTLTATATPTTATGTFTFTDGSATLGTGTITNGVATLTAPALTAGTHTINVTYSGDGNYLTSTSTTAATVTVAKAATTATVSASPATITYLQSSTLTATLPAAATGTVTFLDGTATLGTGTVANGTASFTATSLAGGTHSITAVYAGDSNFTGSTSAAVTVTVNAAASTLALSANPASISFGASTVLTATLANTTGTGTVTFFDGSKSLGTGTISGGAASFNATGFSGGTHSITAVYSGDTNFAGSTSAPFSVTVVAAATTLNLVANPATIVFGSSTTLTATVSNTAATGTVTFKDGAATIGTATIASGIASAAVSSLLGGTHTITAIYSGDTNYSGSTSGATTVTVTTLATTTSVAANPSTASFGSSVTLSATITPAGGSPSEGGKVTFTDGATVLGSGTVTNGAASLIVSSLATGTHTITATYAGDTNYGGSTSTSITVTITQVAASVALAANPSSITYGGKTTLTATLTPAIATGTVTFQDSVAGSLGTATISNGVATLSISTLTGGTHSITASYGGDANDTASVSAAATVTVNLLSTTTTLGALPTTINYGATTMLTANVAPTAATGSVTFTDGATVLGTSPLASGTATLSVSTLSVGNHSITATYSGDGNDSTSTSAAVSVTVSLAPTTATIAATPATAQYGSSTAITVTISATGATGTVTIRDGATTIGTATVSGGVANFTASLGTGSHTLSASYSGDANYGATSTTASATVTITVATSTTTVSANPASAPLGFATTLTAVVSPKAATGTVTFTDTTTGIVVGTATLSGGTASLAGVMLAPAGGHSITATYSGDVNDGGSVSGVATFTVTPGPSNVTLSNTPASPTTFGTKVTFSTAMTSALGVVPTGTMQYLDGATVLGSAPVTLDSTNSPVSTFSTATLMPGTHTLTAVYSGDANYGSTTSSAVTLVVTDANSSITLVSTPPQTTPGQQFTLTATVASTTGSGTPTGTVSFFDQNNVNLGTVALVGGSASITQSQAALGNYSYTSSYSGDADYNPTTSSATIVSVKQLSTSTTVAASPTSGTFGGSTYSVTAVVTPASGGPATGSVTFMDGTKVLGTMPLPANDSATLANITLLGGTHSITATYSGDTVYTASISATAATITVNPAASTTTVSASPATSTFGSSVTLSASVANTTGTVATGNILFMNGSTVLGTGALNASGIATYTTSALPIAVYNVVAVYGGDTNFASSTSTATTVTVTQIAQTITVSAIPANLTYGATPVTFSASASSNLAVSLSVSGPATLSGSTIAISGAGTVTVTATQAGNTTYSAASAVVSTITVARAPLTVTLANITIPYGTAIPTINGSLTGVVNNDNITATYATTATATSNPGSYPITATLADPGNRLANYIVSNPGATLTISASSQTITFPAIPTAVTYGAAPVPLTATASSKLAVVYTVTGPATISGFTLTYTGAGTVVVTATQPGNAVFTAATSVSQTVVVAKAALSVVVASKSIQAGAALPTLTGVLSGVVNGDNITVTYATTATATSGPGVYPITATLVDPTNRLANYTVTNTPSTLTITVNAQTITFPAIPAAVTYGAAPVTLTATSTSGLAVTYTVTGPATVTGSVLTYTGAGTVVVTASQTGNANYSAATAITQTVTVAKASLSVTVANQSRAFGVANPTLTGTLTGVVNGDAITATYATTATITSPAGTYPITATLVDAANKLVNYTVTNTAGTLTVTSGTTSTSLALSASNIFVNAPVTMTATVTSPSGNPSSGTVTFLNGATVLGTAPVNATGVATLTLSTLTAGTYNVTASFAATGNYGASASTTPLPLTVTLAPTTTALTLAPSTIFANGTTTLTATVSSPSGAPTSGTVTFLNGTTVAGTGTVTAGVATLAVTNLPAGTYSFTASFPAGASYAASVSSVQTLTVVAPVGLSLSPTSLSLAAGTSGTSTLTLSPNAGFMGSVALACSSPVTYVICTVTTPLTISGTAPATATISIMVSATYGQLIAPPIGNDRGPGAAALASLLPFGALLLLPIVVRRKKLLSHKGFRLLALLLMAAGASLAVTGCGGGSPKLPPSGAQTVTITATGANTNVTTTLTVNVTN